MIEPTLSAADRAVARSIRYRMPATYGIGAFATFEDGRRLIVVSAGIVQMMEWLSEAIIFDSELGLSGCFDDYAAYLGERIIENTNLDRRGLPWHPAVNLFGYARDIGRACEDLDARDFMSRPDLGEYRARMIEASITFLYLHELAHHVLGHTESLRGGRQPSLAMRRDQEDAADRWAIATAFGADYNLLAAMPAFSFIALIGGNSLEAETKMDHPLGIRRFLRLYEDVHAHYKDHPEEWKVSGKKVSQFLAEIAEQRDILQRKIDQLE